VGARNRKGVTAEKRKVNASGLVLHMLFCAGVQPCQASAFTSRRDTTSCRHAYTTSCLDTTSCHCNKRTKFCYWRIPHWNSCNGFRKFFSPNLFRKYELHCTRKGREIAANSTVGTVASWAFLIWAWAFNDKFRFAKPRWASTQQKQVTLLLQTSRNNQKCSKIVEETDVFMWYMDVSTFCMLLSNNL